MNVLRWISFTISVSLLSGCASMHGGGGGANGPRLTASGHSMPDGAHYAEVGVEFSTTGDFFALFAPSRWKSPIKTGGSLSWVNPSAWSEDAGRTGRILLGEAVVVGAVAGVAAASGGGDSGGGPTEPGNPPEFPSD